MIISGVDPGKTGAMVTIFEDGSVVVDRVPLLTTKRGKSRPNYPQWARCWASSTIMNAPDVFVMELVEARPGQGVTSMFSFGKSAGFAMGVLMTASPSFVHFTRPMEWKTKLGLVGLDKGASLILARELVPAIIPDLDSRAKGNTAEVRHGTAEAALLAYFGRMTISG